MNGTEVMLFARTAARLRPGQIAHRGRLRAQRAALRRWPQAGRRVLSGPAPPSVSGWPAGYRPLDAQVPQTGPALSQLRAGWISLLGTTRELGDWQHPDAPRLWRYHLHYWDWAWALAVHPDRTQARAVFARLWRSWRDACTYRHPDAWHPYPAALRAWSWCGLHAALVAGSSIERPFVAELAAHAAFLRVHLESDVGGNHLVKDLKGLIGLAIFLADDRLLRRTLRRLTGQLAVQVLEDGGHYERAPAYHCQVLADLMDVADLLKAGGEAAPGDLGAVIERMRRWLGAVVTTDGQVPLLNDGYPVAPGLTAMLRPAALPDDPLLILPDTGLVRATAGGWRLLADVGAPCPDELPAHAHADSLGCLLHVNGSPLLVDTGTSTYEPGPVRDRERSTSAHNTVTVDSTDSTEVWGAFRAARRARVDDVSARAESGGITVEGAHDGYRRLPGHPVHHRRWSLTASGLDVEDLVTGRGRHQVTARWHLAPGAAAQLDGTTARITTSGQAFEVAITASSRPAVSVQTRPVALGFGRTAPALVLVCSVDAALPVSIRARWQHASRSGHGAGAEAGARGVTLQHGARGPARRDGTRRVAF